MGFGIEVDKETGKRERLVMFFTGRKISPEIENERQTLRKFVHLHPQRMDFLITHGADADRDDVIAIHTRSAMQILGNVSSYISVPEEHVRDGRAFPAPVPQFEGPYGLWSAVGCGA